MSPLHTPLSAYAHDRTVGVLLHRDDARLLILAGGRRGVLQRALSNQVKKGVASWALDHCVSLVQFGDWRGVVIFKATSPLPRRAG